MHGELHYGLFCGAESAHWLWPASLRSLSCGGPGQGCAASRLALHKAVIGGGEAACPGLLSLLDRQCIPGLLNLQLGFNRLLCKPPSVALDQTAISLRSGGVKEPGWSMQNLPDHPLIAILVVDVRKSCALCSRTLAPACHLQCHAFQAKVTIGGPALELPFLAGWHLLAQHRSQQCKACHAGPGLERRAQLPGSPGCGS